MALAYKFVIFFLLIISHVKKTTTTTASTPYDFRKSTGVINFVSVKSNNELTPSVTPCIVTKPTPGNIQEVTFNFSNMGLQKIGPEFIKSDDIISLILDTNSISDISQYAFRRMRNLHYLNLSGNRISKEKILSFNGTDRLMTLIINNNSDDSTVDELKEYAIFHNLRNLYLSNSQLENMQIPFNITTPRLTSLYLSNNNITSKVVFDNIPWTLTHLYLDRNSIDRVEHDKLR